MDASRRRRVTIRLLIVDDQELVRTGLRLFLETQEDLEVVGEAGDGAEAIERARQLRPDVVLMDIRMPGTDGIEATARLAAANIQPRPRVLVLTTFDLDEYVFGALRAGAAGFLLKDASRERLLDAIRVVHSGDALLSPSITRRLVEDFAARTDPLEPPAAVLEQLTPRERQVLVLVARGHSNHEIAQRLVITEATVKSHVGSILSKLNLRDRVHAVVFAYEHGIVVAGETS
jgi:DNA-binding NarL/FixJ family response regulator